MSAASGTPSIYIRPLNEGDIYDMEDLHKRAVVHSFSGVYPQHIVDEWAASRRAEKYLEARARGETFLVAHTDTRVIGFIGWEKSELMGMYVDPDHHGKGVGSQLVRSADALAATIGEPIRVVHAAINARGFYEKMGFAFIKDGTFKVCGHEIADLHMER